MVYLSESDYIPVTSLRNRPTGINSGYHIDGDIDGWRHEAWDRDYASRNGFNNTRVQRKCELQPFRTHSTKQSIS